MTWWLNPFAATNKWRSRAQGLALSVRKLSESSKRLEESLQTASGRLAEVADERNRAREEVRQWQDRYIAERDAKDKLLQQVSDFQAITRTGMSMFDSVQLPPQPQAHPDWSKLASGPRLAREIVNEKTNENMRRAMKSLGLNPEVQPPVPGAPTIGDELLAQLKAEQDEYLAKQNGLG